MRHLQQPRHADLLPRDPGRGGRAADPAVAEPVAEQLPARQAGDGLALWSMTVIVAPIFGPILGGYISDNYHWGWIFFINIPIGAFVIVAAMATLKGRNQNRDQTDRHRRPGAADRRHRFTAGDARSGQGLDWFNSTEIITLTVVAVVALLFLVVWS
ncbi:MFS transporter [Serratia ureilytica]